MKSPTGELLQLPTRAHAEPERTSFTGALELYDELINFLGLSTEGQQPANPPEVIGTSTPPEPVAPPPPAQTATMPLETAESANQLAPLPQPVSDLNQDEYPAKWSANSGALSQSEDVIRVTGSLVDFVAAKSLGSAMIVCTDCGNASDSGEMFCIHCGGLLEEPTASAGPATPIGAELCDDCGAMVEIDEIFCPSCGSVMASA